MEESGRSSVEKVCFICRYIAKEYDRRFRKYGYYLYLVDLPSSSSSKLEFGDFSKLKPNFKIQFGLCMSVCALGSTLYFTDSFYNIREIPLPKVYSLDIQTLNQNQLGLELGAADFCTLPCMWGTKSAPRITSVPGTKKLLVFSSEFDVYNYDDFPAYTHHDDFEMYDVETNSWEKLPQFLLRPNKNRPGYYFLHLSHLDDEREKGISVPPGPRYILEGAFTEYNIYRYTFINGNGGAVFLVQLSCGVKLTLDLNSPSKGWQLYNDHKKVDTSIPYTYPFRIAWGDGIFDDVSFPQSSFDKDGDDDPVKHQSWTATALDGGGVCIVQGAVSRGSKHGRVIMDVVSRVAEAENPTPLASCRFVVEEKLKHFDPVYVFVYPNQPTKECP